MFATGLSAGLAAALAGYACGGGDLTVPPGPPPPTSEVRVVDGDRQVADTGARLAEPLIVRLLDPSGNPIPDRTVLWIVKAGGGTVSPTTGMTDAQGFASAEWTLGPNPGPNTVEAQVPDVGSVTFGATATAPGEPGPGAGPSATASTIQADPATIPVGTGVSTISVTVRDAAGNPVPGATVALAATGTDNTLTQPAGPTGADGTVTGTLQATTPGERTVSAVINGSIALSRTVTVSVVAAPAVDHLVFSVEPPAQVGRNETFHVEVSLVDANGAVVPLSGIFIYLGLFREGEDHPSNDDLGGERFENTTDGVAAFDLTVEQKGRFSLRALTDDLPELGPHGPEPYLFSRVFEVD
jgi:hypothetical protein